MTFAATFEGLAIAFSDTFGGPYFAATASWPGTPTVDNGGSITAPGTPSEVECRAHGDAVTQAMRQAEGFLETDARLLVLGPDTLDTKATLTIDAGPHAGDWQLLAVTRDPGGIGWECRGRRL